MSSTIEPSTVEALLWGIDTRFDHYVRTLTGDGEVILSEEVTERSDGTYTFPAAGKTHTSAGTFDFIGSVVYRAYLGILTLGITEPRLVVSGNEVQLSVRDDESGDGRLDLATGELRAQDPHRATFELRLTEQGSGFFFGKYPTGWTLAPATLKFNDAQGVQ